MAGDYERFRRIFEPWDTDTDVVAGADPSTSGGGLVAADVTKQIFIQRATLSVTTDAAQSLSIQDTTGTPVQLLKTKASPGLGPVPFDFGPKGIAVAAGKGLDLKATGAGLAGRFHIEGYKKLVSASTHHP